MNQISRLLTLTALFAVASSTLAAPKKTSKKYTKSSAKYAKKAPRKTSTPRRIVARSSVRSVAHPLVKTAPPSKATRPTGFYASLAHQRAVDLVKQAADAYARGNYNKAVLLSKAASDAYPTYARAQTWLGASYHKIGRYDEARSAYKWAMALAPGTVDAERAERGLREIGY